MSPRLERRTVQQRKQAPEPCRPLDQGARDGRAAVTRWRSAEGIANHRPRSEGKGRALGGARWGQGGEDRDAVGVKVARRRRRMVKTASVAVAVAPRLAIAHAREASR